MANRPIINTANAAGVTVKPLEDWVTMEEAARIIGISRSGVAYLIFHIREFDISEDVRTVGKSGIVVLRKSKVLANKQSRDAEKRLKDQADRPTIQHRQIVGI